MTIPSKGLPERWVEGGSDGQVSIRIVKDPDGRHWLERHGARWPEGWKAVINPHTFEPIMVSPETAESLFGEGGFGKTSDRFGQSLPSNSQRFGPSPWINGKRDKEGQHMISAERSVDSQRNRFDKERYVTRAYLRDLKAIPRFVVDTPTFFFDSHAPNPGWMLSCKQRHYNGKPGKLVIKLIHEDHRIKSTVTIRPSEHRLFHVVKNEADFTDVFCDDFEVSTDVIARQVHRPLSSYTDEDLMLELQKRTAARLDGWSPRKKPTPDFSNVINLDDIRQTLPKIDEEKLAKFLAA